MKMTKPIKIRKYGKNQRALKKLLTDEETEVLRNGVDFKSLLQTLIGFEYKFEKIKDGLKLTDLVGDTWIIKTSQEIEIV